MCLFLSCYNMYTIQSNQKKETTKKVRKKNIRKMRRKRNVRRSGLKNVRKLFHLALRQALIHRNRIQIRKVPILISMKDQIQFVLQ